MIYVIEMFCMKKKERSPKEPLCVILIAGAKRTPAIRGSEQFRDLFDRETQVVVQNPPPSEEGVHLGLVDRGP